MRIAVLGAGAWGTALAKLLHDSEHSVVIWAHNRERLEEIRKTRMNERHLPGVELPADWTLEPDINKAVAGADAVIAAVPSRAFREVTQQIPQYDGVIISATKGIEHETGLTMCGILAQTTPKARAAVLSGPTFAEEVAKGIPTAIVAASHEIETATMVQDIFHRPFFRVYTSLDVAGVEFGGAMKNVVAIAAGVCDGMGFGDNSKAALITRAMAEVRRLGVVCGAHAETFTGLSGLGDLTVTCFSKLSRNRGFGERLGRGQKLQTLVAGMVSVVEGYPTARSAYFLARRHNVTTPVTDEVYRMLFEGKNLLMGVKDLLSRDSKAED
jgi:glycerol-3-phosphate dehydrogenase (NAD(P)+)